MCISWCISLPHCRVKGLFPTVLEARNSENCSVSVKMFNRVKKNNSGQDKTKLLYCKDISLFFNKEKILLPTVS